MGRFWALALVAVACTGDPGGVPIDRPDAGADAGIPNCDDQNTCTNDHFDGTACVHEAIAHCCGNGMVEDNEVCDDGNQLDYDGCSHDCLLERVLITKTETILPGDQGCDLNGDGTIDNALGNAMNDQARMANSDVITRQDLQNCKYVLLAYFTSTEPTLQAAPFHFAFLIGTDVESPPVLSDYFSGSEPFVVLPDGLDSSGRPSHTYLGSATGGVLTTQQPQVFLSLPYCFVPEGRIPMEFRNVQMSGPLTSDASGPTDFQGKFCGARTASTWHRFPNKVIPVPNLTGETLLDVLVVGLNFGGYRVTPTQPDVDVDGDGLEHFADTDGDLNVDLCIDGNGTQISGIDCPLDPRIADAYTEAFLFESVGAQLAGKSP